MKLARRGLTYLVSLSAFALAGCFQIELPGNREVGFETGRVVEQSNAGYAIDSRLSAVAHRTEDRVYREVSIEFYSIDRRLLSTIRTPDISTTGRGTVGTETFDPKPVFVVPAPPDLWDDSNLEVYGLDGSSGEHYEWYRVRNDIRFPDS